MPPRSPGSRPNQNYSGLIVSTMGRLTARFKDPIVSFFGSRPLSAVASGCSFRLDPMTVRTRFAPSPTGYPAHRRGSDRIVQLAAGAAPRRPVHPADRRYRPGDATSTKPSAASSTVFAGSGSTGTRGRKSAGRSARITSLNGPKAIGGQPTSWSPRATSIAITVPTASAPPKRPPPSDRNAPIDFAASSSPMTKQAGLKPRDVPSPSGLRFRLDERSSCTT